MISRKAAKTPRLAADAPRPAERAELIAESGRTQAITDYLDGLRATGLSDHSRLRRRASAAAPPM